MALPIFVLIVLGLFGAALLGYGIWWVAGRHHRLAAAVAQSLGGRYPGRNGAPRIVFEKEQTQYRVTWGRVNGIQTLEVTAPLPCDGFRLKVFEDHVTDKLKKFLGMQDLEVGWKKFDRRYVVQSNNPYDLEYWLNRDVQELIWELGPQIEIQLAADRLVATVKLQHHDRLTTLLQIQHIVRIHQALLGNSHKTREPVLLDAEVIDLDQPVCLVCGEPITERRVDCRACQTSHHAECWEYIGSCSRFACGHDRCTTPGNPYSRFRIRT